jgi:DNA helicase IV
MARAASGVLTPEEQDRLMWDGRVAKARAPWSAADLALIDEAAGRIRRPQTFGHLVVDEAQDLSPMELRAIARRSRGSVTLLGDLAQAVTSWAPRSWDDILRHLQLEPVRFEILTQAFRIPGSVLALANRLLPLIAPTVPVPVPVRVTPDALVIRRTDPDALIGVVAEETAAAAARPGSTGVIVSGDLVGPVGEALSTRGLDWSGVEAIGTTSRITLLTAGQAKGLEFDSVVLAEPSRILQRAPSTGLHLLYVVLTRAVMHLTLVHEAPLPRALVG